MRLWVVSVCFLFREEEGVVVFLFCMFGLRDGGGGEYALVCCGSITCSFV